MSEAWRLLKQSQREVSNLYKDIYGPALARRDWKASIFARKTLGDEVQVEAWYLAEHFLLAWSDWAGLRGRYARYFGQSEDAFPWAWRELDHRCRSLVSSMIGDRVLDGVLAKSWMQSRMDRSMGDQATHSSRDLFHNFVANHRRSSLFTNAMNGEGLQAEEFKLTTRDPARESQSAGVAEQLNGELIEELHQLPRQIRQNTLWHLRHYQRANLLASWLSEQALQRQYSLRSALLHALAKEKPVHSSTDEFVGRMRLDQQDQEILRRVLQRVEAAIGDFGYDSFVADITDADFLGGADSPVGSNAINLIPGGDQAECRTILLAVSQGAKKAIGFPSIMRQVREHLIRCANTRAVIMLCDHWHPAMLDEHLGDLRAHHDDRGVRFLFLMVGTPDRAIAPVAVDLGLTP